MKTPRASPKPIIWLMIALCALLFIAQKSNRSEGSCPKGGSGSACPSNPQVSRADELAFQKYLNEARNLASENKNKEALAAINNALKHKPNDPNAIALQSKLVPKLNGMTFIGTNEQGFLEYRHKATGMVFVLIPGGKFLMGRRPSTNAADAGSGGGPIDNPQHEVAVSEFLMGKYEVTQGIWKKVMNDNPSFFKAADDYPVEQVSWNDTQEFTRKSKGLRLPTEAEWEYACRAATTTNFYWGDVEDEACMWYVKNSVGKHQAVGNRKPNGYGLYDMSGNIYEWCSDWYDARYYYNSPKENPTGPEWGKEKVLRGGSWKTGPYPCRSDVRHKMDPKTTTSDIAFRCVTEVKPENDKGDKK